MNLAERIKEIKPYQLKTNFFSIYEYDGVTIQELLCQFFERINNCIDVSNKTISLADWLVNEGLEKEVAKKLELWLIDGTLGKIINEVLLKELEEKIEINSDNIDKLKDHDNLLDEEIEKLKNKDKAIDSQIENLKNNDLLLQNENKTQDNKLENHENRLQDLEEGKNIEIDLPVKSMYVNKKSLTQMIKELNETSIENNSKNILRVGTYNVNTFRKRDVSTTTKVAYSILKEKLDLCPIQEFIDYFTFVSQWWIKIPKAYENLHFNPLWKFDGGYAGMAILSHLEFLSKENGTYSNVSGYEQRGYQKVVVNINGKNVSVYNTHLTHNSEELVKSEMQQLANKVAQDTNQYKVICADFNTYFEDSFSPFLSKGFKPVMPLSTKTIDNILISGNIKVKDYYKTPLQENLSDHAMLVAELEVL